MSLPEGQDVLARYRSHGNVAPTARQLGLMVNQLLNGKRAERPAKQLALADMCLDLAVSDKSQSERRLSQASDALTRVSDQAEDLRFNGDQAANTKIASMTIQAYFKLAELHHWDSAARGISPTNGYDSYIDACLKVWPWCSLASTDLHVKPKVAEFIPVLLGARAEKLGLPAAWSGRLALTREDNGTKPPGEQNRNWDVGLTPAVGVDEFLRPPIRVNVKTVKPTYQQHREYLNGGIMMLVAEDCGFTDTLAVIKGCITETGITPPRIPGLSVRRFTSQKLDDITERIAERLFHTPALAKAA